MSTSRDHGFAYVLVGGPDLEILVGGEVFRFEDHAQLGPCPVTKTGTPRTLGPRHPFWTAVTAWYAQGKAVVDGRCVWEPEADELAAMMVGAVRVGRHWFTADLAAHLGLGGIADTGGEVNGGARR